MSKIQRKFEKIMNSPNNTKWPELKTVLEHYGCTIKSSNHEIIKHPDQEKPLVIPVHNNKVKTVYVKEAIKYIKQINLEEDFDE